MIAALTIAGSDSIGGAGLQADLKAFAAIWVHGTSVVTCVTSQNTQGVLDIRPMALDVIESQMEAVLGDAEIAAAKTGMLYSTDIASTVVRRLNEEDFPLVVDPVLVAGVGDSLHSRDLVETLRREVIPRATLVTPNLPEAQELVGFPISNYRDVERACDSLREMGAEAVLIKGGHLSSEKAEDVMLFEDHFYTYSSPRVESAGHGGGCTLSAYITGFMAKGMDPPEAVEKAKGCIWKAFVSSYGVGKGVTLVDPLAPFEEAAEKYEIMTRLRRAVEILESILPASWVPEVGMNFVFALPSALSPEDICGVEGRISSVRGRLVHAACFDFGASRHVATIALTAMQFDRRMRSALNLRFSERNLENLMASGLTVGSFSRSDEPRERRTMEWGTEKAIMELGQVPDAVYDRGGVGKEPMIRILGQDPEAVLDKVRIILDSR
ncbi:MAG: bifunctional hydroxymethylpyrimidine kinase/phosphomethylpyrimidine kinase [Methanomassiliicoccales archaeon]|nr:bifunctional hydroxymethylpyrimidine kinase/phosphomethylpyrimidine kinase [Methanomassiliicoccales archaeon]NYT14654.1 bifunctional hydroxymethylpyrimidine kinase/phosphomethylpyrimidine kinase [Methanomassiliicoccales archaeon]